ncbi:hypothetical protein DID75_02220 [Candidatus Marinamargulisbacteria bacterium SCGC AG-410-N11]|nr:hypothetical protein DID75_02220 [Candidatus Marinamargulisbacteria bacterium SCGC AG-410-N11]
MKKLIISIFKLLLSFVKFCIFTRLGRSITIIVSASAVLFVVITLAISFFISNIMLIDYVLRFVPNERLSGVNILAYGIDATNNVKRADTILVIHIDKNKGIGVISIPRDTRLYVPGIGLTKVNHAYAHGSTDLLIQSVSKFLNINIDHFVKIDINGVVKIIDKIGGVDVDIESDMQYEDKAAGLVIDLKKGNQRLNGQQAINFLRFRSDIDGDIGRIKRQQEFLSLVSNQLFKSGNMLDLPFVVNDLRSFIESDMKSSEILNLAIMFKNKFSSGKIKRGTIPGAVAIINGISYWRPDITEIDKLVDEMIFGFTREKLIESERVVTQDTEASQQSRRKLSVKEVTRITEQTDVRKLYFNKRLFKIEVLNGFGIKGAAGKAANLLDKLGYNISKFGNAGTFSYDETLLIDWKSNIDKVISIATKLQIDPSKIIVYDKPNKSIDMTLVLGRDWVDISTNLNTEKE